MLAERAQEPREKTVCRLRYKVGVCCLNTLVEQLNQWFPTGVAAPQGAIYNTQGSRELIRFSIHIIEKIFSKCRQTSNQIAMGSPLGAANYISLLQVAASLKRLGTTKLNHPDRAWIYIVNFFIAFSFLLRLRAKLQLRVFGGKPCIESCCSFTF